MSGEAHRLRFDAAGHPVPMGTRAAAVKMGLIVAAEAKGQGSELTADDAKMVTAVSAFFASEYERISTANEEQAKQIHQLERKLMEIARLADVGDGDQ